MFEEKLKEWARAEGFETFLQDHAAVLRNLARWLDRNDKFERLEDSPWNTGIRRAAIKEK